MSSATGLTTREIATMHSLITAPTVEPIDLEEVKKQRRFSSNSLDTLFDLWIAAARNHYEEQTGCQLLEATWEYWLEAAPSHAEIEIPHPPLIAVTQIASDDENGDEVVFDSDNYEVIAPAGDPARRGRVVLVSGASWPTITTCKPNALRIRYRAGYGSAPGAVPELVKYALMSLVGHFHTFGEEVQAATLSALPMGSQMVMDARRYAALPTLLPRQW